MPFDIHSEQKISHTVFSAFTFAGSSVHVLKACMSSFDIHVHVYMCPRLILSINISVGRSTFNLSWSTLG